MKYFEKRRQRKLQEKEEREEIAEIMREGDQAHHERVEAMKAEATVEVDASNDMTAGVVDEISREIDELATKPVRTAKQARRGFPNEEIRHYRHLCPFCKMGWDDAREYQRAVCERTGYPHSDPRHVETTRGIGLRRKAR